MLYAILSALAKLFCVFLKVTPVRNFPEALSRAEEERCFSEMKKGDAKPREKLIEHNLRLVAHIVKRYYPNAKEQDELISIGTVGLIKAVDTFNAENGARFATYASKCIQNEILMYFRSQKKTACEVSINDAIDVDKDGNPLTFGDIVSTEDTIAEDIDTRVSCEKALSAVYRCLDERERKVVILRYGLSNEEPLTQRETAARLSVSRSYISRIEKNALEKLRAELKRQNA
ncbi:MAG: RNA polymerase sporulation sigma factor SigK [Clostridia bacterium]|nr:RNA polymerase sporulation sigma factor SigK [Clostridia bacterium]